MHIVIILSAISCALHTPHLHRSTPSQAVPYIFYIYTAPPQSQAMPYKLYIYTAPPKNQAVPYLLYIYTAPSPSQVSKGKAKISSMNRMNRVTDLIIDNWSDRLKLENRGI